MTERGAWSAYESAKARSIDSLRGRVLEIGAGTGANLRHLNEAVEWIGLEPSRGRRARLAENAARHGHDAAVLGSPAESVALPDNSVDGVLSTLTLCSVRDQARVFTEIDRVLRPGGRAVLVEHVVSPRRGTRGLQHLVRPFSWAFDHGCRPDRDTESALRSGPLAVESVARFDLPVLGSITVPFLVIEAFGSPTRADDVGYSRRLS